jgi:molybdopterin synthase catalytic subunit
MVYTFSMTQQAELIKEIDKLPSKYIGEVLDYVGYLRQKAQDKNADDIEAYKAMASDTERELEAGEWCNAYFGPVYPKPI